MSWNYQRDESGSFAPLPVGRYRIRISEAEKVVSKTGKDMLRLVFEVSGKNSKLFHNIVFLPDKPEITNRNLTKFFDSFKDIPDGDFNTANWIGKVGACEVKHEEYKGEMKAAVKYFIHKDKQESLAPWVEPENGGAKPEAGPNVNVAGNLDDVCPW